MTTLKLYPNTSEATGPSKPKLVLLSGWRGSGKTTVGNYLESTYGFLHLTLAGALRDHVSEKYNLGHYHLNTQQGKVTELNNYPIYPTTDSSSAIIRGLVRRELEGKRYWTPRALLILEGTLMRAIDPTYWASQVLNDIDTTISHGITPNIVISDVRFRNEVSYLGNALDNYDLYVIRINRSSVDSEDASERDLDMYRFTHVVSNMGNIVELYQAIDEILR